jgi:hypothetical protein
VALPSSQPASQHEHVGQPLRLTVPVVGDDFYEENDTILQAKPLGSIANGQTVSNLLLAHVPNLDLEADWFSFVAGAGAGCRAPAPTRTRRS